MLTLEYFEGHKIYDAIGEHGVQRREDLQERPWRLIIQAVFEDGFFHADPHPGNFIMMGAAGRAGASA